MFDHLNVVAASVFVFFFALVTVVGFVAARWKAASLDSIGEWGLGGRQFGPWVTWFLLGGDLYTAYTVIAVPALVYGVGALGFFAVPYTIIIYPFLYATMPRLWAVTHKHHYLTAADFILGRYGNRALELAVALTGIVATMPYIALQLVGLEKVIGALGFSGGDGAGFHHRVEHKVAALHGAFRMVHGVHAAGRLDHAGEQRALRQIKLANIFAEVGLRGLAKPVNGEAAALAQVDGVGVHLKNFLLGKTVLQLQGDDNLNKFALPVFFRREEKQLR